MITSEYVEYTFTEELYNIPGRILIIIPGLWSKLSQDDKLLLNRIMHSVKQPLDGAQVISAEFFNPAKGLPIKPSSILAFGTIVSSVTPLYEPGDWNGIPVLQADALDQLTPDKKNQLWTALQTMFNLS